MGRGLNVLPVTHDFAPGHEPDAIEIVVGVFGGEWHTEQYVVAGFCLLVAIALINFVVTRARRRREAEMLERSEAEYRSAADYRDGLGESLKALRQSRMRPGMGPGGRAPLHLGKEQMVEQ